ncbi:MAG: SDR family oxidoreductase [Bacteroidetes bacterium]|jgi:UDP-N-acetylglucosamine 4-epimerase|nr:SDR family oxidoreductase [Bacteroidota bacterium]MBX7239601.1 SDR family oxidoreductase [Bacteroidia bacterium]MCC7513214.1 SDR family oxidoreductase [Bacteroidia bacterium]MCW5918185.1 SDR family oxidoreductase [Bacteroidota bacterium]HCI58681.1 LPS biosynthesis protein WbpP [Bacteroidota bacterium]
MKETIYERAYHQQSLKDKAFLITGGSGFIGSNIVEYLLVHGAGKVRVLDNLANGYKKNIEPFLKHPSFEFIEGDITNADTCLKAMKGIQYVSHQAALGSVPRSLANPLATHHANATGFLNMLWAAKESGIERIVYASSSSVYGDSPELPKREHITGNPLSPYAVSKMSNELYAYTFCMHYDMKIIGLRYFNVFGPNQNPDNPYAAAIPLFMKALLKDQPAYIFGDGEQSRDFTFVENAVQANIRALFSEHKDACNKVYNIAVGESISLNKLLKHLMHITGKKIEPVFKEERPGDVKNSLADISLAMQYLGYNPLVKVKEGLALTVPWFKKNFC